MIRPSRRTAQFQYAIRHIVGAAEERTDERFVLDLLKETSVLVVHGSGFGADPASCHFRLVYLPDEALLGGVFERIAGFMHAHAARP